MYIQSNVERLKKRKKELGWSNQKVAKEANVPVGTVNKIFSGATKYPRNETMQAIVKAMSLGYYDMEDYGARGALFCEPKGDFSEKKERRATLKTYYSLPGELRAELIDGKIYYTGAPSMEHQCVLVELISALHRYVRWKKGALRLFVGPCDVRLDKDNDTLIHPDLFIGSGGEHCVREGRYDGAPELVMEIVSMENPEHDYERKRTKYQRAGVQEYWIVDPIKERVVIYHFNEGGMPGVYTFDDRVRSSIYPDLGVDFQNVKHVLEKTAP